MPHIILDPTTPDPIIIGHANGWQIVSDAQACGIYLKGSLRFLAFGSSRVGAFERAAMQAFQTPMNESWHHAHARIHEARRVLLKKIPENCLVEANQEVCKEFPENCLIEKWEQ